MYKSQQYLEIAGKFIRNPFTEGDCLHGVSLHSLLCILHGSSTKNITDLKTILFDAIAIELDEKDIHKANDIYKCIMDKLSEMGVFLDLD